MIAASLVPRSLPDRHSALPERRSPGFERFAMLLFPIGEALSTSFGEVPFFNGIKSGALAMLFMAAALSGQALGDQRRGALRWLLLSLGLYTLVSRLVYLGSSGAETVVLAGALLAVPALLWLLNASISPAYFRSIMTWFIAGSTMAALISSGLSIQILLEGGARGWARVSTDVSSNRNTLAPLYVIALSAIMFLPLNMSRKWVIACGGAIVVATLLLFSRSGYIALSLLLVVGAFGDARTRRAAFPLVIVTGLLVAMPQSPILDRIDYTFEGRGGNLLDDSAAARVDIWRSAFREFENNPFFGGGSGKSPLPFYDVRRDDIIYAHNYFLTQLSQLGIFGLAITLAILGAFLLLLLKQSHEVKYFSASIFVILISTSVTGEPLYTSVAYLFYIACIYLSRVAELPARPINVGTSGKNT